MSPAPPSSGELRPALEGVLSKHLGQPARIVTLRRTVSPYSSSSRIEHLAVRLDRGRVMEIVFKDATPGARIDAARSVRPAFIDDPRREIVVYRDILANSGLGSPLLYGTVEDRSRLWLFLERVRGPHLWQAGRVSTWCEAARWLGELHYSLRPAQLPTRARSRLIRCDESFFLAWMHRASRFRRGKARPNAFERLAGRYGHVAKRLAAMPRTFIHGEFYPSNVLVRSGRKRRRICVFDWETASVGPGALDLAALTSGEWDDASKARMIATYRSASGHRATARELSEDVEWCRLHLAVQMLGWSEDWSAPAHHARDWMDVALRQSRTLGVT